MSMFLLESAGVAPSCFDDMPPVRPRQRQTSDRLHPELDPSVFNDVPPTGTAASLTFWQHPVYRKRQTQLPEHSKPVFPYPEDVDRMLAWGGCFSLPAIRRPLTMPPAAVLNTLPLGDDVAAISTDFQPLAILPGKRPTRPGAVKFVTLQPPFVMPTAPSGEGVYRQRPSNIPAVFARDILLEEPTRIFQTQAEPVRRQRPTSGQLVSVPQLAADSVTIAWDQPPQRVTRPRGAPIVDGRGQTIDPSAFPQTFVGPTIDDMPQARQTAAQPGQVAYTRDWVAGASIHVHQQDAGPVYRQRLAIGWAENRSGDGYWLPWLQPTLDEMPASRRRPIDQPSTVGSALPISDGELFWISPPQEQVHGHQRRTQPGIVAAMEWQGAGIIIISTPFHGAAGQIFVAGGVQGEVMRDF